MPDLPPIRAAGRNEQDSLLDTLALAFARDPMVRFWWPQANAYLHWWRKFLYTRGEQGFEHGSVMVTEGYEAVAMWLPPGVEPDPAALQALDQEMGDGPEEAEQASQALRDEMARYHPQEPHWYLWALGVDPRLQGKGLGGHIVRHTLRQIDAAGSFAYLESSDPNNVPFYERLGFEVVAVIEVPGLPPLTPMIRRR